MRSSKEKGNVHGSRWRISSPWRLHEGTSVVLRPVAPGEQIKRGKDEIRLFMLSADLFPKHAEKFVRETARGIQTSVADDFSEAIKFLMAKKESSDILIVFNGRSRSAEGAIVGSDLFKHKDAGTLFLVYDSADPNKDVRVSKRAAPMKALNTESLHIVMPPATSKALKLRQFFNKCGEKSTHENSLTGVPHRHLPVIPRLDKEGVEQILGHSAAAGAEVAVKAHVQEEIEQRGHPLFWAEYKSVHFSACSLTGST